VLGCQHNDDDDGDSVAEKDHTLDGKPCEAAELHTLLIPLVEVLPYKSVPLWVNLYIFVEVEFASNLQGLADISVGEDGECSV